MVAAALALMLAQAPVGGSSTHMTVLGAGNDSCGKWTDAKTNGGWPRVIYESWLGGFVSGMNMNGSFMKYGDLTEGMDIPGMVAWVDNYCAAKPLDKVMGATEALVIELLSRKPPPPR